jgi:hypothetical protein
MPSVARTLALDHPLYSKAELIEHRRNILRYASSSPFVIGSGTISCWGRSALWLTFVGIGSI